MSQVDFQITTDLEPLRSFNIEANFAEVKDFLQNAVEPYKAEIVTESGVTIAKTNLAKLRKVREAIEQSRKAAKEAALAPYNAFAEKTSALVNILDSGIENLDRQVKDLDNRRREQKLAALKAYFEEKVGETADYLTWEDVKDERYGNVTYSESAAQLDIIKKISNCRVEISSIKGLNSEFESELLLHYTKTHNIASTLAKNTALLQVKEQEVQKKEREERRRQEEQLQKKAEEERAKTLNTPDFPPFQTEFEMVSPTAPQQPKAEKQTAPDLQERTYTLTFKVTVTETQLGLLRDFLKKNGIKPERA